MKRFTKFETVTYETIGTSLQGELEVFESKLKQIFGEKNDGDGWAIMFDEGSVVATIYKLGEDESFWQWRVGGFDSRAYYMVQEWIEASKDIEERTKEFIETIVTDDLIKEIKELARYKGKEYYVGDADVHVRNRGVFTKKETNEKIKFGKKEDGSLDIIFNTGEYETTYTKFDVTEIRNSCRCTDDDTIIVIAERLEKEHREEEDMEIYVYSIREGAKPKQYTQRPSFKGLKKSFELGEYTAYNSLLRKDINKWVLLPYNDSTDRIFNINALVQDLDYIKTERYYD